MLLSPRVLLLILAFSLQILLWSYTNTLRPALAVIPPLPHERTVSAMSLGDSQFYFRTHALRIQNAGDTFGRFTPFKHYDYQTLSQWLYLLDGLDPHSDLLPTLASYYYSQTQRKEDVRYLVNYLADHARLNPEANWWWLGQAVYLANHTLNDKTLALSLAEELARTPGDLPAWTRQMPALIHAQLGEKEEALIIIKQLLEHPEEFSEGEINYMHFFINERLESIMHETEETAP